MITDDLTEELVAHLPALRAFAVSLCRDRVAADDLVQDTVEKAWTNFDKFRPGTNMRAWLFTILRNTYYSDRRKARREVADPDGAMSERLSEKPAHDGHLQLDAFRAAFRHLPDEQREAVTLVGAGGFSYEEAAEMCGVAPGTVKSRASRGRRRLAELMELGEGEPLELTDAETVAVVTRHPGGAG